MKIENPDNLDEPLANDRMNGIGYGKFLGRFELNMCVPRPVRGEGRKRERRRRYIYVVLSAAEFVRLETTLREARTQFGPQIDAEAADGA